MLTLAVLAVAVVSTSALPTPELSRPYDDFDFEEFQPPSLRIGCEGIAPNSGPEGNPPEWSDRPEEMPVSARLLDELGGFDLDKLSFGQSDRGNLEIWKRMIDTLGGNRLVRSLDHLGGNNLDKKAVFENFAKRVLDTIGGNRLVKRPLDHLGGNRLIKRPLDALGGNRLVKRPLDHLGGNRLVKRLLDTLGGNRLVKRPLDNLGGNRLVKRLLDTLGGSNLIKKSGNKNPNFVDHLGGGHLLKRSPQQTSDKPTTIPCNLVKSDSVYGPEDSFENNLLTFKIPYSAYVDEI